jgi:antitoxin component YwqK of YwqJK toxin-antitoxin module/uncharacterized protein YecT (DUF1311 family)
MLNWLKHAKWADLAFVIFAVALLQGCGEKIDVRQTESTNGLLYKLHDNEPFSGTVAGIHVYQGFGCTAEYKKGVLHGSVHCTYDNGKKAIESHWAEGKRDGAEKFWFTDGTVQRTVGWSDGAPDGLEEHFNPDGAVITQIHWTNGKKAGSEKFWDVTGKTLLVSLDWKDGLKTGFDKSGEGEENYKDGKLDGVRRHYARDPDNPPSIDPISVALAQHKTAEDIGGGTYSASIIPGYYVEEEEQYRDGVQVSKINNWKNASTPAPAQPAQVMPPQQDTSNQAALAPQTTTPPADPSPTTAAAANADQQGAPFAPGFNCAKVTRQPEILICSDRELSGLDVQLNQSFSNALARGANKQQLQADEVNWVKSSRNVCADKDCLVQAYRQRISALSQ